MSNPFTDEFEAQRKQYAADKDHRAQLCASHRTQHLTELDQRTGYNIITGLGVSRSFFLFIVIVHHFIF